MLPLRQLCDASAQTIQIICWSGRHEKVARRPVSEGQLMGLEGIISPGWGRCFGFSEGQPMGLERMISPGWGQCFRLPSVLQHLLFGKGS